jgi:hypothetical protein
LNKSKVGTTLGVLSILSVVVGFILVLYFFGMAAIFELLGVQYNSNWSLVVFVVSFFILGVIVELFTEAIFKLSVRNITGKMKVLFIRISFESTSNWLVLFTVDEFMRSITLSLKMEVIIALLLAVLEMAFGDDEDKMSRGS